MTDVSCSHQCTWPDCTVPKGGDLPPLPEPEHTQVETCSWLEVNTIINTPLYTADQLCAAVAKERETIAAMFDDNPNAEMFRDDIAAAIRAGS